MSEELLLFKMKKGDEAAFEFFFKEYAKPLYHVALGIIHDSLVAEDIVQDIFIRFWLNRGKLDISLSVLAYLRQSVVNACCNHLEYIAVRARYAQDYSDTFDEVDYMYESDELEVLRERLHTLIDSLPEKCREIFVLACVEGLKYREVAERLDVSVNTVKTQVKVAYSRIRSEYGDQMEVILLLLTKFLH